VEVVTMHYIELSQCPDILQDTVNKYLSEYNTSKLLCVKTIESTPYKDKSITRSSYRAYVEWANLLSVFNFTTCSKEEWTDTEVREDKMIAGDISEFIKQSWWFKESL
jgi:hypothetical protein